MRRVLGIAIGGCLLAGALWLWRFAKSEISSPLRSGSPPQSGRSTLAGSGSCRECHERFYTLWSTSHHGSAMRPFTPEFAQAHLKGAAGETTVGEYTYRTEITAEGGVVIEVGPEGEKRFPILHVLGGKNIFYFLTSLDRGRLQVLPLAYDVRKNEWFNTQASAVRHLANPTADALSWRDPAYTFNTSCFSCHLSQLSKNYDVATDTYHTVWAEPGINCETCHGPGAAHVRAAKQLPPGQALKDPRIIRARTFTPEQQNATCAPCHAKMIPLTSTFTPGDRYFDHFDLVTLEDPDFYPDGRDLGENYTYTLWRMSPCVQSGQLSCLHCHTSSGRYRFRDQNQNGACLPCHEDHVKNPMSHTHHQADSKGSRCIACHMPTTEFARMRRTDHSMRPPMPAATLAFNSPNACNLCHGDRNAAWANRYVRQWRKRDYQAPTLHRARLLAAARKGEWSRLPEMLEQITGKDRDEVYATSFIRLLVSCPDERKWPVLREALKDRSPLVRSAAAMVLSKQYTPETRDALLSATEDEYRLVRIRAAAALAAYPRELLNEKDLQRLEAASAELEASFNARPDDWVSQYNLGNYYADRKEFERALKAYERASRLRPDALLPLV
ncbi:MAG: HEAT repeat domain-containing protein, partial [candidate division WOR-3 bacterium]